MLKTLQIFFIVVVVLIFICIVTVYIAAALFNRQADREAQEIMVSAELDQKDLVQSTDLNGLPACVQKWLQRSGVIGQPKIHTVRLTQTGRMRLAPGKPWMPFTAVQYINVYKPAFVWKVKVKMSPFLFFQGKDRYSNGLGSMQIRLLSLYPIVNAQPSKEMNQGTLVRYLAEMIWYPTAALNDYIRWEEVDSHTARAFMNWQGTEASMLYHFTADGDISSNEAVRYQEVNGHYELHDWGGVCHSFREFNGIRIANRSDVLWKYESGDFNWLQMEISKIDFNQDSVY